MMGLNHEKVLEEEKMNTSSECSSGCQSGWTMYLDHSYDNPSAISSQQYHRYQEEYEEEEEEEDLSMISDASSGPPHFCDDEGENCSCRNGCFCSASSGGKKRRLDTIQQQQQQQHNTKKEPPHSFLFDDTASSPFFSFSKASYSLLFSLSALYSSSVSLFILFICAVKFLQTSCNATTTTSSSKKKLSAEDVLDLSCGFSATQFKGKFALRKHLGYFKSCAPIKPTSVSKEEGEKKMW